MDITDSIIHYRRFLKRRNYSPHTVRNYLNMLQHYIRRLNMPVEAVSPRDINNYIDFLMERRLHPKTINCHLECIRGFYDFLRYDENMNILNPVRKGGTLRLPAPLPRYLNFHYYYYHPVNDYNEINTIDEESAVVRKEFFNENWKAHNETYDSYK